jgi:hypothetical protein
MKGCPARVVLYLTVGTQLKRNLEGTQGRFNICRKAFLQPDSTMDEMITGEVRERWIYSSTN